MKAKKINEIVRFMKESSKCFPFYIFLKKEGCFGRYIANIKKENYLEDVTKFFDSFDTYNYITLAFCWADSKEGYFYWGKIGSKWYEFYKKRGLYESDRYRKYK